MMNIYTGQKVDEDRVIKSATDMEDCWRALGLLSLRNSLIATIKKPIPAADTTTSPEATNDITDIPAVPVFTKEDSNKAELKPSAPCDFPQAKNKDGNAPQEWFDIGEELLKNDRERANDNSIWETTS